MLKIILAVVVLLIAGVLILAATRPDVFRVERSTQIKAPPEKLFALINDLRRFNTWNPYEKKDPDIQGSYSGAEHGIGAKYAFRGNKDVGVGNLEITESAPPEKVAMRLNMVKPFAASNNITFSLEARGELTRVTWAMEGPAPYFAKIIGLFINMDSMVGRDFEAGLANLKSIAEAP